MYKVIPIFSTVTYIKWKNNNETFTMCDKPTLSSPYSLGPLVFSKLIIYSVVKYVTEFLKVVSR